MRASEHDRTWDVIVVGAGPAGAAAAIHLAHVGLDVLIVDRESLPRGKLCGSCLSIAAVREVRRLFDSGRPSAGTTSGDEFLERLGAVPLECVRLAAGGTTARIDMPRQPAGRIPGGMVLSRDRLDAAVLGLAIDSGRCRFLPRMNCVRIVEHDGDAAPDARVVVRLTDDAGVGHDVRCRLAVVATGLADHVRIMSGQAGEAAPRGSRSSRAGRRVRPSSRVGVGTVLPAGLEPCSHPAVVRLPPGELVMAVGRAGYCGIVRLEDGRLDLAAAVDRTSLTRTDDRSRTSAPATVVTGILGEAFGLTGRARTELSAILASAAWRATPPLSHTTPLVAGTTGGVLRVGDAAGYVEPFTGEGIGWALASGRLLAAAVTTPPVGDAPAMLLPPGIAVARYTKAHARHFGPRHARCGRVARGLRMPVVVRTAVRAAGLAPWAARHVATAVVGASRTEAGG